MQGTRSPSRTWRGSMNKQAFSFFFFANKNEHLNKYLITMNKIIIARYKVKAVLFLLIWTFLWHVLSYQPQLFQASHLSTKEMQRRHDTESSKTEERISEHQGRKPRREYRGGRKGRPWRGPSQVPAEPLIFICVFYLHSASRRLELILLYLKISDSRYKQPFLGWVPRRDRQEECPVVNISGLSFKCANLWWIFL